MTFCPECGEENPEGSKYCRKCGINLVYEEPKTEQKTQSTAKKVTVEDSHGPVNPTVNTHSSTTTTKNDDNNWLWCCVCVFFLFIIFAIFGH